MASQIRVFLFLIVLTLISPEGRAQIDWSAAPGLTDEDKANISALLEVQGYSSASGQASSIRVRFGNDEIIIIASSAITSGLRRTWREYYFCRRVDSICSLEDVTAGAWAIEHPVTQQERWRISDGDWYVDVELGIGVSYTEARTIVMAIRHNSLTVTPESLLAAPYLKNRTVDASRILSIRSKNPVTREFYVNTQTGGSSWDDLTVRLVGDGVQLEGLSVTRA